MSTNKDSAAPLVAVVMFGGRVLIDVCQTAFHLHIMKLLFCLRKILTGIYTYIYIYHTYNNGLGMAMGRSALYTHSVKTWDYVQNNQNTSYCKITTGINRLTRQKKQIFSSWATHPLCAMSRNQKAIGFPETTSVMQLVQHYRRYRRRFLRSFARLRLFQQRRSISTPAQLQLKKAEEIANTSIQLSQMLPNSMPNLPNSMPNGKLLNLKWTSMVRLVLSSTLHIIRGLRLPPMTMKPYA